MRLPRLATLAATSVATLLVVACGPKSKDEPAADSTRTPVEPTDPDPAGHEADDEAPSSQRAPARDLPPIDEARLAKAASRLSEMPADDDRAAFAARSFAQLERDRVTRLVLEGFEEFADATPERRDAVLQRTISTNVEWFESACTKGDATVLVEMGQRPANERAKLLVETCGFSEMGLVETGSIAQVNGWTVALAHVALAQLVAGGPVDERERALLVAMLGG